MSRRRAARVGGVAEVAAELGVHVQTVKGWRARGVMPEPIGTVSGAPAFDLDAVARWYASDPPRPGRPAGGGQS